MLDDSISPLDRAVDLAAWLIRTRRRPPGKAIDIAANKHGVDRDLVAERVGQRGGRRAAPGIFNCRLATCVAVTRRRRVSTYFIRSPQRSRYMSPDQSVAYVAASSVTMFSDSQPVLATAIAAVVVDIAGNELGRASRCFVHDVELAGIFAPATAHAGELAAVWLATTIAPPDGLLIVCTSSESASTMLAKYRSDAVHPGLAFAVRGALEARSARLAYAPGSSPEMDLARALAAETLGRADGRWETPEEATR